MYVIEELLTSLPRYQALWEQLAMAISQKPTADNAYFLQSSQPELLAHRLGSLQVLHWQAPETIVTQWANLESTTIERLLILGLEKAPLPQTALTELALLKEKTYPHRHFHWLIAVGPQIATDFKDLLSFLDGKSYWFDLRIQAEEWDIFLTQWLEQFWDNTLPWQEAKQWQEFQELMVVLPAQLEDLEHQLSPDQRGQIELLKGLYQEGLFLKSSPYPDVNLDLDDPETTQPTSPLKLALQAYQNSWQFWQELTPPPNFLGLGLRIVYVYILLIALGLLEKEACLESIQNYLKVSFQNLKHGQNPDFRDDSLELWGLILRELENWEGLRAIAELYLVFFYQLTPCSPHQEKPETGTSPWSKPQLQNKIASAYGLLSEALIEQWRFDEARESLKRALENYTSEAKNANLESWLYYLSGRCLLGQDQLDQARSSLTYAQSKLKKYQNPCLYGAILVELRECYYQQQHWEEVLQLDQDYQAWEYLTGQRNFVGAQPLPCLPSSRPRPPLVYPGPLFFCSDSPFSLGPAIPAATPSFLKIWATHLLDTVAAASIVIVMGAVGTGKRSLLQLSLDILSQEGKSFVYLSSLQDWPTLKEEALPDLLILGLAPDEYLPPFSKALPLQEFWRFLVVALAQQQIRLIVPLPPQSLSLFWSYLHQVAQQENRDLSYCRFSLLSLPFSWSPFTKAPDCPPFWQSALTRGPAGPTLIRELGLNTDSPLPLSFLELQCLGSELEERQKPELSSSEPLYWCLLRHHCQRQLQPLPPLLQQIAQRILTQLACSPRQPADTPLPRKTLEQLFPEGEIPPEAGRLLSYLCQAQLVSLEFPHYCLVSPFLARALYPQTPKTEALTLPDSPSTSAASPQQFAVTTHTKQLLESLDPKSTAAEKLLASKLEDAEHQYYKILQGIRLERQAFVTLKQFEAQSLESLVAALHLGQTLEKQVKGDTPWMDYPSLGPLLTLQCILDGIYERNRLQDRKSCTCLELSPDQRLIATATTEGKARLWDWQGTLLRTLRGHQAAITDLQYHPHHPYLITASADNTARLWHLEGQKLATLTGHEDWLRSARFSPHHEFIVTASRDRTLRVWNFAGEELVRYEGHSDWVRLAEFSSDGQTILSASRDGTARLWDLEGRVMQIFKGHKGWVRSALFSPDGTHIITASTDGTARIWSLDGKCVLVLRGHQNWVRAAHWSPDGEKILTASTDGTARIWSAQGKTLAILQGHPGGIHGAEFSPDRQHIVTTAGDGGIRFWDYSGRLQKLLRGHQKDTYQARFGAQGQLLVSISADHTARIWDLRPKENITLQGHENWVRQGHFNRQGDQILTASRDHTARLWDRQGNELVVFRGHQDWVRAAQFSPDGQAIATISADKTGQIWNPSGEKQYVLRGHQGSVLSIDWSGDSQYLVTGSKDGTARVWNRQGQSLALLRGHEGAVFMAKFSPDHQFVSTSGADQIVRIWDIVGRELAICKGHGGPVYSVQWSQDGRHLLTAGGDGVARIWDFLGKEVACLTGHQSLIYEAQWSPDEQLIVTASADQTARIWDKLGRELVVLYGHQGLVSSARWSPQGQLIATAGVDGTARLWDRLGRELATFSEHRGWVRSVEFSPDGAWVLTTASDGLGKLWPVRSLSELIKAGCQWLTDYLLHNPLVKEGDRLLVHYHPTLGDTEHN